MMIPLATIPSNPRIRILKRRERSQYYVVVIIIVVDDHVMLIIVIDAPLPPRAIV